MSYKFGKVKLVDIELDQDTAAFHDDDTDEVVVKLSLTRTEARYLYHAINENFVEYCQNIIDGKGNFIGCKRLAVLTQKMAALLCIVISKGDTEG